VVEAVELSDEEAEPVEMKRISNLSGREKRKAEHSQKAVDVEDMQARKTEHKRQQAARVSFEPSLSQEERRITISSIEPVQPQPTPEFKDEEPSRRLDKKGKSHDSDRKLTSQERHRTSEKRLKINDE